MFSRHIVLLVVIFHLHFIQDHLRMAELRAVKNINPSIWLPSPSVKNIVDIIRQYSATCSNALFGYVFEGNTGGEKKHVAEM